MASAKTGLGFRALDIPVQVTPAFLLVSVVAASTRDVWGIAVWVACAFVSVLVHELGHALVARRFARRVRIELHGMGGTAWHEGPALTTSQSVAISLAGPFAGFALGAAFFFVDAFVPIAHPVWRMFVGDVLWVTLGYGALNLLPILPLDGGHVLQALLQKRWPARGDDLANVVSVVVAAAVFVVAVYFRVFFLGFLLIWLVFAQAGRLRALWQERQDRGAKDAVDAVARAHDAGDVAFVARNAGDVAAGLRHPPTRARLLQMQAHALLALDRPAEAMQVLQAMPAGTASPAIVAPVLLALGRAKDALPLLQQLSAQQPLVWRQHWITALNLAGFHKDAIDEAERSGDQALVEHALFFAGRFDDALAVSRALFQTTKDPVNAYNAACACARLGRSDDAFYWLEQAVGAGYDDRVAFLKDDDLAGLRADARYEGIARKMT